nr:hypothetical protein Itr_chr07CG10000 [Ipomoea trifida]
MSVFEEPFVTAPWSRRTSGRTPSPCAVLTRRGRRATAVAEHRNHCHCYSAFSNVTEDMPVPPVHRPSIPSCCPESPFIPAETLLL